MTQWLKQSTATTVKLGPFLDATDGVTAETGLTISQADIRLSKNGGDIAQTNNAAGATHDELGYYDVPLDTTDTGTLGRLRVAVHESGAAPVWQDFMVVPANVWDSMFGSDKLDINVAEWLGTAAATPNTAGYPVVTIKDGTGTGEINTSSGVVLARDHLGNSLATSDGLSNVAGDVSQVLVELGSAGAGLTSIPWNSSWDTEVQSEVTDAIVAHNLDHLCLTATAGADMTAEVADNTILSRILSNGDTSVFAPSTDGLQPIRDELATAVANVQTDVTSILTIGSAGDTAIYNIVNSGTHGNAALKTLIDAVPTLTELQTELDDMVAAGVTPEEISDVIWTELVADHSGVAGSTAAALGTSLTGIADLPTNAELATALAAADDATLAAIAALNNLSAAQVNAEVDSAIETYHLDHLLAATYDPASKPGAADALLNELVENDGGVSRYTANALEQAPTDGSAPTVGEIADAVLDEALSGHTTAGTLGKAIADVESDVTLILEDTGTTLPTALATIDTEVGVIDGVVDTILVDTNELQTDWANGGRLDNILDARASQTSVDDVPTNAELATALAAADDAVLAAVAALNNLSSGQVATLLTAMIETYHLDHLFGTTYDPSNKPGASDALLNELVENDGGVARFTANTLELGPTGTATVDTEEVAGLIAEQLLGSFAVSPQYVDDDRTWWFRTPNDLVAANILRELITSDPEKPIVFRMNFIEALSTGTTIASVDSVTIIPSGPILGNATKVPDQVQINIPIYSALTGTSQIEPGDYLVVAQVTQTDGQQIARQGVVTFIGSGT